MADLDNNDDTYDERLALIPSELNAKSSFYLSQFMAIEREDDVFKIAKNLNLLITIKSKNNDNKLTHSNYLVMGYLYYHSGNHKVAPFETVREKVSDCPIELVVGPQLTVDHEMNLTVKISPLTSKHRSHPGKGLFRILIRVIDQNNGLDEYIWSDLIKVVSKPPKRKNFQKSTHLIFEFDQNGSQINVEEKSKKRKHLDDQQSETSSKFRKTSVPKDQLPIKKRDPITDQFQEFDQWFFDKLLNSPNKNQTNIHSKESLIPDKLPIV